MPLFEITIRGEICADSEDAALERWLWDFSAGYAQPTGEWADEIDDCVGEE